HHVAAEREQLARMAVVENLEPNGLAGAHQRNEPLVAREPERRARTTHVSGMAGKSRSIHRSIMTNSTGIYQQQRTPSTKSWVSLQPFRPWRVCTNRQQPGGRWDAQSDDRAKGAPRRCLDRGAHH